MTIGSDPNRIGATVSSEDATTLAALDATGFPPGTVVYVTSLASNFTLTISTASLVTNSVVAVSGIDGYRWIVNQGAGTIPLTELASQADKTIVGNNSGGSASPTALTTLPVSCLTAGNFHSFCSVGANASVTPTHIAAVGVKIGDKVIMIANVTDHASAAASFEATVTVTDQIQQATTDLSAKTLVILVVAQS